MKIVQTFLFLHDDCANIPFLWELPLFNETRNPATPEVEFRVKTAVNQARACCKTSALTGIVFGSGVPRPPNLNPRIVEPEPAIGGGLSD